MNWFYKWLGKKISDANIYVDENQVGTPNIPRIRGVNKITTLRESDDLNTEPITFKMFKASGGWAIEFRQYDNRNDRIETSLYVVNDEEELGKHISQIITMEALKR